MFALPQFLTLLILLPLMGLFWFWTRRQRQLALAKLGQPALIARLQQMVNENGRLWQTRLWFLALALIILALARPQWGSETRLVAQEGVQIMIALDVSASMLAEDLKPNRLTRAKLEIVDLMGRLSGDEVGLVVFSGASFIQFPLTSDYSTARAFLDNARPEIISRPGTVIGDAIETAVLGFDPNRSSQKVIIIMTDGEDQETDPVAVAERVAKDDVVIYTVGFGSAQGEPIPEYDEQGNFVTYKKDRNGEAVLSRLDEETLQRVAAAGNGRYFRASADGRELALLASEISSLQSARLDSRLQTQAIERYQWVLFFGFLALLGREFISERVR